MDAGKISAFFKGEFVTAPEQLQEKLSKIRAYVFDWDGVFNNGQKDEKGSSPFSEVDSMGTNMLRFSHYLLQHVSPVVAVISGEKNKASFSLSTREHFNGAYYGIKNKTTALRHLCNHHNLKPEEVAFFFDDVLDLAIARECGVRIMVNRKANPLLIDYARRHGMVDYLTSVDGGNCAVREGVELLIGLPGNFDETMTERINFSEKYQAFIQLRNSAETLFYTVSENIITETAPQ
jgi:3-deoxy-D-manno-octulosonate 8-phosphate phosphatase (KDO 8-P phosphatase)